MKIRSYKSLPLWGGLVGLFLIGCTEPITIDTDNSAPVIVIYGELTNEWKQQEVMISRSSPYFDDVPNQGISGATVTVRSSNNETWRFVESDSIGLYRSPNEFRAQPNVTYSLTVEVDFDRDGHLDKYEASTTVLPAVTPDSLSIEPFEIFGHKNYFLYLYAQDPPEENYYLFSVTYNDSLLTTKLSKYITSDDAFFTGQYAKGNLYSFDDISEKEADSEERRKRSVYLQSGDRLEATISAIPKGYFDFINQCKKEKNGENPMFGGPPSNIITNISNGGVGYFSGYYLSKSSIIFEN